MRSLSFPDVNVWLALVAEDHVHHEAAKRWWEADDSERIAFIRLTQIGLLRLLTNAAVMGNPRTMQEAWAAHDRLYSDDRVDFLHEPPGVEKRFRTYASEQSASPKLWADAWLLAFAEASGGTIVTFDRPLASRSPASIWLG